MPSIFVHLLTPGFIVECTLRQAKHFCAFKEDTQLRVEIEKRREIVDQVDAIYRLEGFTPEDAPDWFKELTEDYILGKVSAEAATQKALEFIKSSAF